MLSKKSSFKLVLSFLTKRQKWGVALLILASVFQTLLELAGISSIIPIISLISDPSTIQTKWYLSYFYNLFHFTDSNSFLVALVIAAICLYFIRTVYVVLLTIFQNKFIYRINVKLSAEAYEILLRQPYEFHLLNNSAVVIKKATYDTQSVTECLGSYIGIFNSLFMAVCVIVFLIFVNPAISAIVLGVLLLTSFLVIFFSKRQSRSSGNKINLFQIKQQQEMRESLGAIKELSVFDSAGYFAREFQNLGYQSASDLASYYAASALPRYVIESVGMISMLGAILIAILTFGSDSASLMTTFSAFAVAIVKLLPYASTLSTSSTTLSFRRAGVTSLEETFALRKNMVPNVYTPDQAFHFEKQIEFNDVSFHYAGGTNVLNHVSLTIPKGTTVAFSGPSGAGKSTSVDILLGLLTPQSGSIVCDGKPINSSLPAWHAVISYVPQYIYLSDKSIRENVAFGIDPSQIDDQKIAKALKEAQLEDFVSSLPNGINTLIGENGARISGGQRQRIGIARALYRDAPVVILDEATSSLDYDTEDEILKSVEALRGQKTLIVITHRTNTISNFDLIYEINHGKISKVKG
jgi:ABC-type multidrug transport system fused ATPase/permease subunit